MNGLKKLIQHTLKELTENQNVSEGHYTTWKKIEEGSPIDNFEGKETEIVNKLAKHFKIGKVAPLGSGTSGFAYYIPNNRVLKVTKDKSEAAEAHKIQGNKSKHLANVYNTYTLGGKYAGTYVIISELLGKTERIDEGDELLRQFFDKEFGYGLSFFFEDYRNGSVTKDEIKDYIKRIKEYFNPSQAQIVLWYMNGMFGVINEIKKYNIHSTDWGPSNLGIKKDGNLAMYDLGYGDPDVPPAVQDINLNEWWSADEYPEFTDGQFNPLFKNRAYPAQINMNTAPLAETEISSDDLHKKDLPYQFPELFEDFVQAKTEAEIREIAPAIDLNQNPISLMADMEKNYPSLFDNFADWLYNRERNQTTF